MTKIHQSILELIGRTPLLELKKYADAHALKARLLAKLESFNPGGSVKDRIAAYIIDEAESRGDLDPDTVIIEPTSGNTGIGIAMTAAAKGYRCIIVMPEGMSAERQTLMRAYGAELILTPANEGMKGAIIKANDLMVEIDKSFMPSQFTNPLNPAVHRLTTGPEIWEDTDGKVDFFVAGVGTGGTLSGIGEFLRSKNPDVKIIAVEPASSPVLSQGKSGTHKLQGIGAGFVPDTLNTEIYDEIIPVGDEEAFATARELARIEGVLSGISSGAAVFAAAQIAQRSENAGKTVVTLLPDTGERYLSTSLFTE